MERVTRYFLIFILTLGISMSTGCGDNGNDESPLGPSLNIASSATASASSEYTEHESYASNINDGSLSTVWSPARYSSYPQWCDLNWSSSVSINKVVVHPGGNGSIQSYEIWINNQKVTEASGIGTYDTTSRLHTFSAVTTTKLRYLVTSYNDARYAHTSEIEVYSE